MILVTGATGFLGTHLLLGLLAEGKPVKAIKRKDSDVGFVKKVFCFYEKEFLFPQINWVEGDMLDEHFVNDALSDCDLVFNCAAQVSFDARDAKNMIRNNVQITSNVVNACLQNNVKKLCHVSSIAALGNDTVISESTPRDKKENYSAYSKSKYESDLEVMRGTAEGLQTIIVYPSVLLGPWKIESGMFPLIENLQKGMKYFPQGASAFIDVRDVATLIMKLSFAEIENENFVLSSENLSYEHLFQKISSLLKVKSPDKVVSEKMMKIASRLNDFKYFFSHKSNPLSKELVQISNKKIVVSTNKINAVIAHKYFTIEDSIHTMIGFHEYLKNTKS